MDPEMTTKTSTTMTPSKLLAEVVTNRSQLNAITEAALDYSDESRHLFFPAFDNDRAAALHEVSERLWIEHTSDPASHWIYVRDPDTQSDHLKVIGACQWRIYTMSEPFPNNGGIADFQAMWWPDGAGRDFTTRFVRKVMLPRARWMNRPHVGMSWIFVHPEHRRHGIGTMLMNWGMTKTDELGLESYIEATTMGRYLYESCGYVWIMKVLFNIDDSENEDELWKQLEKKYDGFGYNCMWRPPFGKWAEGEPQRTWNKRMAGNNSLKNYDNWLATVG